MKRAKQQFISCTKILDFVPECNASQMTRIQRFATREAIVVSVGSWIWEVLVNCELFFSSLFLRIMSLGFGSVSFFF